jgi:hypothetical protein
MRKRARRGLAVVTAAALAYGGVALTLDASADEAPAADAPSAPDPDKCVTDLPAVTGPVPSRQYGDGFNPADFKLVRDWNFGTNGTIKGYDDLNREFMYKDEFGTINNGGHYGSNMVAPDSQKAYDGAPTIEEEGDPRSFGPDSITTSLIPIHGNDGQKSDQADPPNNNVGNGSFTAKTCFKNAGKLLGKSILWETSIRYDAIPQNWFALWNAGKKWDKGAEFDVVESYGFPGNEDGHLLHADPVGAKQAEFDYLGPNGSDPWDKTMAKVGIPADHTAATFHTFAVLYRADDTFTFFLDGLKTNAGTMHWTEGGVDDDSKATDFFFLFDLGFGHNSIDSVRGKVPFSKLQDKHYEIDFSRVYLSK